MIRYTQVDEDDVEKNLKIGIEILGVIQTILIVMIFMILFQTMIMKMRKNMKIILIMSRKMREIMMKSELKISIQLMNILIIKFMKMINILVFIQMLIKAI